MKHKKKWLEYARQYQTISDQEWWKVVFSDEEKFNLDNPHDFQKYWHTKNFPEEDYSTRQSGRGSPMMWWEGFSSSGKFKLQFVCGRQKAADYVKMLNNLSLAQEGRRLCGEEWIFQQDNSAIHNASIIKNYSLEQKIKLVDHPACSPDLSLKKICGDWFLQKFMKKVKSTQQFLNLKT